MKDLWSLEKKLVNVARVFFSLGSCPMFVFYLVKQVTTLVTTLEMSSLIAVWEQNANKLFSDRIKHLKQK